MADGEPDKLIGQTIADRYEVLASIDAVGSSRIYKVKDTQDSVQKALKIMSDIREEQLSKFLAEAELVKNQIKHPAMAQLQDFGVVRDSANVCSYVYMVYDYLSGRSLYNVLNRQGRIELSEALPIFIRICEVSKHLHAAGISQIQLSPRKIVLSEQGDKLVARISDPGLSSNLANLNFEPGETTTPFPEAVLYLSPEQCSGMPVDERSDVYSLGCIMYECLVGLPPFLSKSPYEVSKMHQTEVPKMLRLSRNDLNFPLELDLLVSKSLQKLPHQRQQSFNELLEDLQHVQVELSKVPEAMQAGQASKSNSVFSAIYEDLSDLFGVDNTLKIKIAVPIILGIVIVFGSLIAAAFMNTQAFKTSDPSSMADREWQQLDAQAQKDFEHGNTTSAENRYIKALAVAEKFGDKDRRFLETLRKLQDVYFTENRFDKADEVEARIKAIMAKDSP